MQAWFTYILSEKHKQNTAFFSSVSIILLWTSETTECAANDAT